MSASVLQSDGTWRANTWRVVRDDKQAPGADAQLLPLMSWLAGARREADGVWLASSDDATALVRYFDRLPLIAVDFPKFTDGRGYSIAALLRRLGFRGDLRAVGDVLIDQLFMLKRVGFTSFVLRADQDAVAAVAALNAYSDVYQAAADRPLPYFRRRSRAVFAGATA